MKPLKFISKYWLRTAFAIYAFCTVYLFGLVLRDTIHAKSVEPTDYEARFKSDDNLVSVIIFVVWIAFPFVMSNIFYLRSRILAEIRSCGIAIVFLGVGIIACFLVVPALFRFGLADDTQLELIDTENFQGSNYYLGLRSPWSDEACVSENVCGSKFYHLCKCDQDNANCSCPQIANGRNWEQGGILMQAELQVDNNTLYFQLGEETYQVAIDSCYRVSDPDSYNCERYELIPIESD